MWFALAWAVPAITPPVAGSAPSPHDAAVVVGIEDYAFVDDVPHAVADAHAMAAWLERTRGLPADRVQRLPATANREQLLAAAAAAAEQVDPAQGTVWLYLAGQGAKDAATGDVLVFGVDVPVEPAQFRARSVSQAEWERAAAAQGAPVVALYDLALHPAASTGPGGAPLAGEVGPIVRWTGTAVDPGARAWERAGHGAFTFLTLGALQGWADGAERADQVVTLTEADLWVTRQLGALGGEVQVTRTGTRADGLGPGLAGPPTEEALRSLAAPPAAVDPCARPDWVDAPPSGATVSLEAGWPDPRLGRMAAAAVARRDAVLAEAGRRARWTSEGWETGDVVLDGLQVTGQWRDCATGDHFAMVQVVASVGPPGSSDALQSRVDAALVDEADGVPAWALAPPVVPGVVLSVGVGADRDEARDLAVTDLGLALRTTGEASLAVYDVDGHARMAWSLTGSAPVGCGQLGAQLATGTDDAGWHYVLWGAPSGDAAASAAQACEGQRAGQKTMTEAKMRSLVSDARSRAVSSPTAGLAAYKRALAAARTMSTATYASGSVDWFRGETTDWSLTVGSWAGVLDCPVQLPDLAWPAEVRALAGKEPTNLEDAGVCTSLMPEVSQARRGARR